MICQPLQLSLYHLSHVVCIELQSLKKLPKIAWPRCNEKLYVHFSVFLLHHSFRVPLWNIAQQAFLLLCIFCISFTAPLSYCLKQRPWLQLKYASTDFRHQKQRIPLTIICKSLPFNACFYLFPEQEPQKFQTKLSLTQLLQKLVLKRSCICKR